MNVGNRIKIACGIACLPCSRRLACCARRHQCAVRQASTTGRPKADRFTGVRETLPESSGDDRRSRPAILSFTSGVIPRMPVSGRPVFVAPWPFGGDLLHLLDGCMDAEVRPFMADRPVVAPDVWRAGAPSLRGTARWFCCGVPGWMQVRAMPCFSAPVMSVAPTYPEPLFTNRQPRHSMVWFSNRTSPSAGVRGGQRRSSGSWS